MDAALTQLTVIRHSVSSQHKKFLGTQKSIEGTITRYSRNERYSDAHQILPSFCILYEQTLALAYLLKSIETIKTNIKTILSSPECPASFVPDVAAICFASRVGKIECLPKFVKDFFVKAWKAPHVEQLANSDTIPEFLHRINPRDSVSIEELHVFAHRFEQELKMDFGWLYLHFPIEQGEIESMELPSNRRLSSPPVVAPASSMESLTPVKRANSVTGPIEPIEDLLPPEDFDVRDYDAMMEFVNVAISKWNVSFDKRQ